MENENENANHREKYHLKYPNLNDTRKTIKLLLGRDPLSSHEVRHYSSCDYFNSLSKLLENDEFYQEIFLPVILTGHSAAGRYNGEPSQEMLRWVSNKFDLEPCKKKQIIHQTTWRCLLSKLWETDEFLSQIKKVAEPRESIKRFQRMLRDTVDDTMSGIAPVFSRPKTQVPACKLLIVEKIDREHLGQIEYVDLNKKITGIDNLKKIEAYVAENDPQITIQADVIGRFVLEIEIEYTHSISNFDVNYVQIFFDFGAGYQESASYSLEISENKVSAILLLNAEERIQNLRIDPSVSSSVFIIRRLALSNL